MGGDEADAWLLSPGGRKGFARDGACDGGGVGMGRGLLAVDPEDRYAKAPSADGHRPLGEPSEPYEGVLRVEGPRLVVIGEADSIRGGGEPLFTTNNLFGIVRDEECASDVVDEMDAGVDGRLGRKVSFGDRRWVLEPTEEMEGLRVSVNVFPVSKVLGVRSGNDRGTRDIIQRKTV